MSLLLRVTPATTDTATVYLALTPSAVEIKAKETVDADTELFKLTPSGADIAQYVDAVTETFALTPSASDVAAFIDSNTEVLALVPSAADTAQFVDSATEAFSLVPSGSDIFAGADAATETFSLKPSSQDVALYVDSGREDFLLTPSATDLAEYVDSATELFNLIASSTDIAQFVDSATEYLKFTPSGDEIGSGGATDLGTIYLYLDPIGTTYEDWFDDGIPTGDFQYFGTYLEFGGKLHVGNGITNGTAYYNASAEFEQITITFNNLDILLAPFFLTLFTDTPSSGGCGILIAHDGANPYFEADIFGDNGSADASSGLIYGLDVSSRFYLRVRRDHPGLSLQFSTNGTSWTTLVSSSADWYWMRRTVDTSINIQSGSQVDIEHFLYETQTVDTAQFSDSNTGILTLIPSSTDAVVRGDSATTTLSLVPSSIDVGEFVDVLIAILKFTPSGVDILSGSQGEDAETLYLHLTPGGTEVLRFIKLIGVLLQHYSGEAGVRYGYSKLLRRRYS